MNKKEQDAVLKQIGDAFERGFKEGWNAASKQFSGAPLPFATALEAPAHPEPPRPKLCVVCGKATSAMCPACKAYVCTFQKCGQAHGHDPMLRQS